MFNCDLTTLTFFLYFISNNVTEFLLLNFAFYLIFYAEEMGFRAVFMTLHRKTGYFANTRLVSDSLKIA